MTAPTVEQLRASIRNARQPPEIPTDPDTGQRLYFIPRWMSIDEATRLLPLDEGWRYEHFELVPDADRIRPEPRVTAPRNRAERRKARR